MTAKSRNYLRYFQRSLEAPSLTDWLGAHLAPADAQVQVRLRGNILHVLCETTRSLPQLQALTQLVTGLLEKGGRDRLTAAYPQVYQLYVYSRQHGKAKPDWTAPIYLTRLERHQAQLRLQGQDPADVAAAQAQLQNQLHSQLQNQTAKTPISPTWQQDSNTAAIVLSHLSLARKGDPDAIAWYLSEVLSALDVGVWVSIRAIPGRAAVSKAADPDPAAVPGPPRLWILCEADHSPDPQLIAEPVTERLRQLELTQFKDAVLLIQVQGEASPDWSLRIDLTPPAVMLAEWSRWGDAAAIAQLLNTELSAHQAQVTVERKAATLHLAVTPTAAITVPPEATILEAIEPLLARLAPQGLHRAMIYGQRPQAPTPDWVRCLNLPAMEHPALAEAPQTLASRGDWPALTFLLTRRLNPSLAAYLATGGIHVQVLQRGTLLHVMVDGPVCPARRSVAATTVKLLRDLAPPGIEGVRIYGRRAGQQRPTWSYGTDFKPRQRLVPQAEPEFAASDAYVNDLLAHPTEEALRPDLTAEAVTRTLGTTWQQGLEGFRQLLLKTPLLVPQSDLPRTPPAMPEGDRRDVLKIGLVWALAGALLALQTDWLLGQVLNPITAVPDTETVTPETRPPLPDRNLDGAWSELEWGQTEEGDAFAEGGFVNGSLTASPDRLLPSADILALSPFPSFRSQQMDEKLALYYQRLQQVGTPDVLVIGSSRALRGIDPAALQRELAALGYGELNIFNFGVNGSTAQVVELTLRRILTEDQLPRLILWADGARAFNSGRVDVTYNGVTASEGYRTLGRSRPEVLATDDPLPADAADPGAGMNSLRASYQAVDQQLSDRLGAFSALYGDRDRLKAWVRDDLLSPLVAPFAVSLGDTESALKNADMPLPENSRIDFDGFLALDVRFNPATYYQLYARVSGLYDSDYERFELEGQQSAAFKRLLRFTQGQNIPLVFVNTPLTDEYLDAYRLEAENTFQQAMLRYSVTEPGFIFRDLAQTWPNRYDYFSDPSHLNRFGAYQVSNRLAQDPMIPWPKAQPQGGQPQS